MTNVLQTMNLSYVYLVFWMLAISSTSSRLQTLAQTCATGNSDEQIHYYGTRFVLGFLELHSASLPSGPPQISIIANCDADSTVKILFSSKTIVRKVSKGMIHNITLDTSYRMTGTRRDEKRIEVTSNNDIAVFCSNRAAKFSDRYLVLPTSALHKVYVASSYDMACNKSNRRSNIGIITVNKSTAVNITLTTSGSVEYREKNYTGGNKISLQLLKAETFHISSDSDLSGTIISADEPIAVISGSSCANVFRGTSCGVLNTFLLPVEHWGKTYVMPSNKIIGKSGGDIFRVFVSEDQTNVHSPYGARVVQPGSFQEIVLESSSVSLITCSKPCQVVHYVGEKISVGKSIQAEYGPMNLLPSVAKFPNRYDLDFSDGSTHHTIALLINASDKDGIKVGNNMLTTTWQVINITDEYKWSTVSVTEPKVTISHTLCKRFGVLVFGTTTTNMYGYPRTFDFECTNTQKISGIAEDINRLSQIPVNESNVLNITRDIADLTGRAVNLSVESVLNISHILENISKVNGTTNKIIDDFCKAINNVLNMSANVIRQGQVKDNHFTSRIIQSFNTVLEALDIRSTGSFKKDLQHYALDLSLVNRTTFDGLKYPESDSNGSIPRANSTTIEFPKTLFDDTEKTTTNENETVIVILYKTTTFFETDSASRTTNTTPQLNSLVIAGSVKSRPISRLKDPVKLEYTMSRPLDTDTTQCVYWNLREASWSGDGCTFQKVDKDGRIICHCNHLTNFAILMSYDHDSPSEWLGLTIITYIGAILSLIGLALTIFTILFFRDLRRKVPQQIMLNFCIALSSTLIIFLVAVERAKTSSIAYCRAAAIALHYFVLVTFFWMAIDAFNIYLAYVKVFAAQGRSTDYKFMLRCCLVAWGIPAVIVSITMGVALDEYTGAEYCRLGGIPFLAAFLTPILIILLGNSIAFIFICHALLTTHNKVASSRRVTGRQQARQGITIFVLLGLTWLSGVLVIKDPMPVFQYLFCIFNSLQGLLVFVFYCVLPQGIRKKYIALFRKATRPSRKAKSIIPGKGKDKCEDSKSDSASNNDDDDTKTMTTTAVVTNFPMSDEVPMTMKNDPVVDEKSKSYPHSSDDETETKPLTTTAVVTNLQLSYEVRMTMKNDSVMEEKSKSYAHSSDNESETKPKTTAEVVTYFRPSREVRVPMSCVKYVKK